VTQFQRKRCAGGAYRKGACDGVIPDRKWHFDARGRTNGNDKGEGGEAVLKVPGAEDMKQQRGALVAFMPKVGERARGPACDGDKWEGGSVAGVSVRAVEQHNCGTGATEVGSTSCGVGKEALTGGPRWKACGHHALADSRPGTAAPPHQRRVHKWACRV
jgi:hypothetical protein